MNYNGAGLCWYWLGWTARNDGVPCSSCRRTSRSPGDCAPPETRPVCSESASLKLKAARSDSYYVDVNSRRCWSFAPNEKSSPSLTTRCLVYYLIDVRVPRLLQRRRSGISLSWFLCVLRTSSRRPFSSGLPARLRANINAYTIDVPLLLREAYVSFKKLCSLLPFARDNSRLVWATKLNFARAWPSWDFFGVVRMVPSYGRIYIKQIMGFIDNSNLVTWHIFYLANIQLFLASSWSAIICKRKIWTFSFEFDFLLFAYFKFN